MSDLLFAQGIEKRFGASRVLRGVDFRVGAGEVVGLFGPNGSGKTTLVNVISGLVRPDRGRILFDGKDVTRLSMDARFRAGLSRTFQIPGPFPSLNVLESVRVALLCGGARNKEEEIDHARVEADQDAVLSRTGLFDQRYWPSAKLSQGCLRRLEFARAISCRPKLILLDEVFSALSGKDEAELAGLTRSLNREEGVALVIISHNVLIIEEMCDRVAVLEEGRIAWEGKPSDLSRYVPAAHSHGHAP